MIGQYLSNNNENSYSAILQKKKNASRPAPSSIGAVVLILNKLRMNKLRTSSSSNQ
jgi:hypothetical protein